jgi:hypothetical protein
MEHKSVFLFSLQHTSKKFLILRIIQLHVIKLYRSSSDKKNKFSIYIFETPSHTKFCEKSSSGSRIPLQHLYYITGLALVLQSVWKETMNMNRPEKRQKEGHILRSK